MKAKPFTNRSLNWRWIVAAGTFLCGFIGLLSGVSLSERPDVVTDSAFTKAYYALGLFVVGGMDTGTPTGGPIWAQGMLWFAFFSAPLLTATAVIETIVHVVAPGRWQLRNMQDHTIIFGSGEMALGYLAMYRKRNPKGRVIVVDHHFEPVQEEELKVTYNAATLTGDPTHAYLLSLLRLHKARRVVSFGDNDFQAFEAATKILELAPQLAGKVILRCLNLRFMRSIQETELAGKCEVFNPYNLAATGFVRNELVDHFARTENKDTVILAGFGRFGQSVLEELQVHASGEIQQIAVIDKDADRRVLVVDEQKRIHADAQRRVYEGDISHPLVWENLTREIDLSRDIPTIILGTGQEQDNLRTALWLKAKYPNAQIFTRTTYNSKFALEVGNEHGIKSISMTQLAEDNMPEDWLA